MSALARGRMSVRLIFWTFVLVLAALPSHANAQTGLVGWWRFDEASGTTTIDSSGAGNNGTFSGTVTRVPGKTGNGVSFTGNALVKGSNSGTGFPVGTSARTIAAWIKLPAGSTDRPIMHYGTNNSSKTDSIHLWVDGNGFLGFRDGGSAQGAAGGSRVDDGTWHHVAGVYEGPSTNVSRVYVDGALNGFYTLSDVPNTGTGSNWQIGEFFGSSTGFPGTIDEVRVYNRALSPAEVQLIVNGDGGVVGTIPVSVAQTVNSRHCLPKPATTTVGFGDTVTCSIEVLGESRLFSFQAHSGDQVTFNVARISADTSQCYQITDPDGVAGDRSCVGSNYGSCCNYNYPTNSWHTETLTKTGIYIVQISEGASKSAYDFVFDLKREIPLPASIPQLTNGISYSTQLLQQWDSHYYAVMGTAGDRISAVLTRTAVDARDCLAIYSPQGQETESCVNSNYGSCCYYNFQSTIRQDLTLTQTGGYVFRVRNPDELSTFSYSFVVNCVGTCSNALVPPQPQTCNYSLSPLTQLISAAAGKGVLGLTAPYGCPWSVSSSASFLTITTASTDGGPDTIGYVVSQNTSAAARTAIVSAAGQSATITQLGTSPLLSGTPTPLVFSLRSDAQTTTTIPLNVFTNLASLAYTASVTMTTATGLNWLSLSSTKGSAPTTIGVTVDPTLLPPGSFTGSVTINSPTASPTQLVIPVTVSIKAVSTAVLNVSNSPISFNLAVGGTSALTQLTVSNSGTGVLAFTASVDPASPATWLSVNPTTGGASSSSPATLVVSASPGSLPAGTYSSNVIVSGGGTTVHIPVTMTLGASGAQILLSQVGLRFVGVSGGGNPSPQTFGILNSGVGTLHWTAAASTQSAGNWLQVSATSGTVNTPFLDVSLLSVSVNTAALPPGDYYGKVLISGDAVNSGQLVAVIVSVLPPGSNPGPEVRPSGLIFVSPPGQKPGSQPVNITNLVSQPVSYTSTPLTLDGSNWLSQTPVTATIAPNVPGSVTVQSDNSKLPPGILRGVVTLLFQDGTSTNVNVLNVVTPTSATPSSVVAPQSLHPLVSLHPFASGCASPTLQVQFVSIQSGFQAPLSKPATVLVKVVDNCGNALVPSSGAATPVSASFSNGDPDLTLVSEGGGQWAGTWTPTKLPSSGTAVTVTVHAAYVSLSSQTLQTGLSQVSGTLLSGISPSSASVLNLASLVQAPPAGAGSLISIYGSNMANQTSAANSPSLPTDLSGTEVSLGGVSLPLFYSSAGQINAQIPYDIAPNTQQQLVVKNGNTLSVPTLYSVAAAQPGIFTQNLQGSGQGVIVDAGLLRYAEPGTPAARGDTVIIYCTGLGAVAPPVQAGAAGPYPAATTVNPVSVSIGGSLAQVQSAVLTPGSIGVFEVYAIVPTGALTGDAVPVTVSVAGQTSNTVTMAVK